MDYLQWNNLLGDYFFGAHEATREISLFITKEQLISLYANDALTDDEKWADFINVINDTRYTRANGTRVTGFHGETIVNKITTLTSHAFAQDSQYPMILPFLVLFIIAKTENEGNTDAAFYQVVVNFFKEQGLLGVEDAGRAGAIIRFLGGKDGVNYWNSLSDWSLRQGCGRLDVEPIGGNRYVGYIRRQCLLSRNQIQRLPDFFILANVSKDGDYTLEEFRRKILANSRMFSEEVVRVVKNEQNWRIVTKVIYNYFKNEWDGQGIQRGDAEKTSRYTVIPLHLCVYLDDRNERFEVNFRTHTDIDDYDNLKIYYAKPQRVFDVTHERDGWSCLLEYSPDVRIFDDRKYHTKYSFDFQRDYYVMHPNSLGEYSSVPQPLYEGEKLLIVAKNDWEPDARLTRVEGYGDNEFFSLFRYTFHQEDNFINENIDTLERNFHIELDGGLPLRGDNRYLSTITPRLISYDQRDNYPLRMVCEESGEVFNLTPLNIECVLSTVITWEIPACVHGNFIIRRDDEVEITRIELCDENIVDFDMFTNAVRINNKGEYIEEENVDYFCDNEVIFSDNVDFGHDPRIAANGTLGIEEHAFEYSMGDYLIDWLYHYGKCSRKIFENAFSFLQQKYVNSDGNTNFTDFKNNDVKSTINILRAGGFIEIDRNRNIIPCRPRFVALPIGRGGCNVAKLIGCRSLKMLAELTRTCNAYPDHMRYHCSFPQGAFLNFRLTPSTVYVELIGNVNDNYGYELLERWVCRELTIKSPDYYFFDKFRRFIPSITDFDTAEWLSIEGVRRYNDFESRIFDPDQMEYEIGDDVPCEFNEFFKYKEGRNIALIKVVKTKYEIVFVLINKRENTYLELSDEGMGKYYVIHKKIQELLLERGTPRDFMFVEDAEREIYFDSAVKLTGYMEQDGVRRIPHVDEIAIMKKARMPRLMDKFLNLITLDTPYLCMDIDGYRSQCPFLVGGEECVYKRFSPCPHRYYLYKTCDELVDFIDSVIREKIKIKPRLGL